MTIAKKIPTFLVMGVAGYVTYSVLFPEENPAQPKSETRAPAASRKPAKLANVSARNPFSMPVVVPSAVAAVSDSTQGARLASSNPDDEPDERPARSAEEDKILGSMKLEGTFVDRRGGIAVIDGKVYNRGDRLRGLDGNPLPYVVVDVSHDRAMVRRGRRDFAIAFSDAPRPLVARAVPTPPSPGLASSLNRADGPAARPKVVVAGKSKKGGAGQNGRDSGAGSMDQRELLMKLLAGAAASGNGSEGSGALSALTGLLGGSSSSGGSNPLSALTGGGSSPSLDQLLNSGNLEAGLDAIMGKGDSIGRESTGP